MIKTDYNRMEAERNYYIKWNYILVALFGFTLTFTIYFGHCCLDNALEDIENNLETQILEQKKQTIFEKQEKLKELQSLNDKIDLERADEELSLLKNHQHFLKNKKEIVTNW